MPWTLAKVLAPYELTLPTDLDAGLFLLPEVLDIIDVYCTFEYYITSVTPFLSNYKLLIRNIKFKKKKITT